MPTRKERAPTRAGKKPAKRSANAKPSKSAKARKSSAGKPPGKRAEAAAISGLRPLADIRRVWAEIAQGRRLEFRVSCVRPDDLLVCDFIFENLRLDLSGERAPKLARKNASTPVLIVEFPPQSFGEEAFLDAPGQGEPDEVPKNEKFREKAAEVTPPVNDKNVIQPAEKFHGLAQAKIRMSGSSRIAFSMPANETELPFTIEAILDACRRWPMRLDVNAVPDPPRLRVRRAPDFRDMWLGSVVSSNAWKEAKEILVDTVGNAYLRRLASAAHRVSTRAVEAIRSGSSSEIDGMLHGAINEELDVLAEKFPPFRDQKRRDAAAAAVSFMATERLTEHRLGDSVFDLMKELPFVRLIFPPHEPAYNVTALELPYRLILSPVPDSRWHHHTSTVTRNGRTELWHTRLTSTEKDIGPDGSTRVRALWSDDYREPGPQGQIDQKLVELTNDVNKVAGPNVTKRFFRMSLDPLDRLMLVALMSGFDLRTKQDQAYQPRTAHSRRLSLSSLGALLEAEGEWDPPKPRGLGLEQWRHVATLGRDHYVRVVYRGFLCHARHAASLVKVTERKFESTGPGVEDRVAVLRQRFFIVVRERVKHYDGKGVDFGGRKLCFTDIEITTSVTPTLLSPDDPACDLEGAGIYTGANAVPRRACFWPMIGPPNQPRDFLFNMIGTDRHGNRIPFSMPLLFVGIEANEFGDDPEPTDLPPPTGVTAPNVMTKIRDAYNQDATRRSADLGSFSVCYAPPKDGAKGDPRLPTRKMTFIAAPVHKNLISTDEAHFYPAVQRAKAGIAAIQRLLQKPDATVDVEYADAYLKNEFGPGNKGEVFLKLVDPFGLTFGKKVGEHVKSDAIGGLATPSMAIVGLSRIMGPVAAQPPKPGEEIDDSKLENIVKNSFKPVDFFQDARILGGVKLAEIIKEVPGLGLANPEVPKLLSRETGDRIEASFDWTTSHIKVDGGGLFLPHVGGQTTLDMHGVVSARKDSKAAPTFSATASINNFKVNLFGFVTIWFDNLEFRARTGQKPDVAVDLHPGEQAIEFGGPLEFVNDLRSIIPSNGFSDPPGLSVTPSGITASYSLSIPSLAVGIFALEHLSLGAGFLLPFDAQPAEVRFNFAERQRPFSLTVSFLGGGGFFAIGLGSEGVREIEAALEFGAALSINLGVASGSVEVKAGVYYHWKTALVELEGYVRLHGELDVLGLISASLTFHLTLGYTKQGGQSVVWGEAKLEVEIEILFLSFSVSVKCRREFGGSAGDPKFIELIPDQSIWDEYCGAFAKER